MNNFLSKSGLKLDKDANFNLERILSGNNENTDKNFEQFWKPKKIKGSESDASKLFWEFGRYSEFIGENGRKSWFDLPFRCDGELNLGQIMVIKKNVTNFMKILNLFLLIALSFIFHEIVNLHIDSRPNNNCCKMKKEME